MITTFFFTVLDPSKRDSRHYHYEGNYPVLRGIIKTLFTRSSKSVFAGKSRDGGGDGAKVDRKARSISSGRILDIMHI